jgi:pimeloyl-ACP methyl ester carboxylesterase
MSDTNSGDLDEIARQVIDAMRTPKRRVRPRIAGAFRDAEDIEVETAIGPVMAWRLGKGPATLLVHGWEDDNCLWGALADKCAALGRAVVAMDLPGHGFTRAELDAPDAAAVAIRAVADACGPIDSLVGHSFGCIASMQAMSLGLGIPRAVFIAPPIPRMSDRWQRVAEKGVPDDVIARAQAIYAEEQAKADTPPPFDPEAAAETMTAKALFVHSLDDDSCPASNSQDLKRAWPGAKIILTDGLGHRLIAQDDAILSRVVDFVEGFGG